MVIRRPRLYVVASALAVLALSHTANAQPVPTVKYEPGLSAIDTTDYSSVPADGWWFANFDTSILETGQPVAQNAVDNLPSWLQLDNNFDPNPATSTYSWDQENVLGTLVNASESTGGNAAFNSLTLPDGTSGLSGQAITTWEAGNDGQSRNLVSRLLVGPDAPPSFRLWVVVDNEDANTGTGVRRVKARLSGAGVLPDTEDDTGNGIDDTRNNVADAYSFLYKRISEGDNVRIQLRTTNSPIGGNPANILGAGMAGFIVQEIPEPTTAGLLVLGVMGVCSASRRRV